MVHVKSLLSERGAHSLTGETGRYTLALVPQDEHWTGHASREFNAGGSGKASQKK